MRLHVDALFTRDAAGRLLAVNEAGGTPAPRFFLGRTAEGNIWWFRCDVHEAVVGDLHALCEAQPIGLDAGLVIPAPFIARLSREEPVRRTWTGPAFHFPPDLRCDKSAVHVTSDNATVLSPYLEAWRDDVSVNSPMVVALDGGKAVSLCASVRVTPHAHEAGVETHPVFRGRGHAARAVSAWASAVRELGRIPLYSTSWENEPSRALAKKLSLIQFGVDLHIT
jgi:RimJ/RimL family protein N-acetyltransferase